MPLRLVAPLLLLVLALATATRADEWVRVSLINDDTLDVALLLKPVASPADEQFIGFEFNNKTARPLPVYNANYRLDSVRISLRGDGRAIRESSLASGNTYCLLWRDAPPPAGNPDYTIEPGITRRARYNSDYSVALLGWPQARGFVVEGVAHLTLSFQNDTHLWTPPEGVPFRFEWVEPDERGLEALRRGLRGRLATRGDWLADAHFIGTALSWPPVVSAVSVDELLAALRGREQQRDYLVRHLNTHHADHPAVKDHYLRAIGKRDRWALADLARVAREVNDPRYIEPLMEILRDDTPAAKLLHYAALRAAARQIRCGLADDPAALRRELASLTLRRCSIVAAGAIPPEEQRYRWSAELDELAETGEESLVPRLRRYLDCSDVVIDARRVAALNNGVSLRVCDLVYNAILDLQGDRDSPRISLFQPMIANVELLRRERDEWIERMRRQIDSREP